MTFTVKSNETDSLFIDKFSYIITDCFEVSNPPELECLLKVYDKWENLINKYNDSLIYLHNKMDEESLKDEFIKNVKSWNEFIKKHDDYNNTLVLSKVFYKNPYMHIVDDKIKLYYTRASYLNNVIRILNE